MVLAEGLEVMKTVDDKQQVVDIYAMEVVIRSSKIRESKTHSFASIFLLVRSRLLLWSYMT